MVLFQSTLQDKNILQFFFVMEGHNIWVIFLRFLAGRVVIISGNLGII